MSALVPLVALLGVLASTEPSTQQGGGESMPPWGYGLTAFGIVLLSLAVLWAFRSVGKRH
jgi:protein-S-isoprenylcysteine O-methyltransferase Ste14